MTITWTEAFASFTPSTYGYAEYDIYTNLGVPKGAIAYIVCSWTSESLDKSLGVRTGGSSVIREGQLNESEGGGSTNLGLYVKVNETTGKIETYVSGTSITGVTFYLLGYWTGVDFVETRVVFNSMSEATGWLTYDSDYNNAVLHVSGGNDTLDASVDLGVRTYGSSLARTINVHEAESAYMNHITMCVKTDSSGRFEYYHTQQTAGEKYTYYIWGYFLSSQMNYTELAPTAGSISSASTWTDMDCSSYLDRDGRVVDAYCMHYDRNGEMNVGARVKGSTLSRYILEHEAETNGNTGYGCPTSTDASGILQFYCDTSSSETVGILGYYKPIDQVSITKTSDSRLKKTGVSLTKNADSKLIFRKTITKTSDAVLKRLGQSLTKNSNASVANLFDGRIDEVCIYNSALSSTEVNDLYYENTTQTQITKNSNATLSAGNSKTIVVTSDARIKTLHSFTKNSDADLKKLGLSFTKTSDAKLILTRTASKTTDARLKKSLSDTKTSDSRMKKTLSDIKTSDSRLKKPTSFTKLSDSILKKVGISFTKTSDSRLKLILTTTKSSDSRLKSVFQNTKTSDARLLSKQSISKTSDADLKDTSSFTKTSDAEIRLGIQTLSFTKDSDARLKKLANELTKTSDAKLYFQKTVTKYSDARLKAQLSTSKTGDARLKSISSFTKASDARFKAIKEVLCVTTDHQETFDGEGAVTGWVTRIGQKKTVSGTVSSIGFRIKRSATITGNVYARIRKVSDDTILAEQSMLASDVPLSYTWVDFTFPSPVYINESVYILIEHPEAVFGSKYLTVDGTTPSVKSNEFLVQYDTAYDDYTFVDYDLTYHLYYLSPIRSDARLKASKSFTKLSDARLKKTASFTKTSDARLRTSISFTKTSDARLKIDGISFTKSSDARLLSRASTTKTSDAFIVLNENLKARYNMQTLNGSDLKDLSGYGNHGTPNGSVTIGGVTGISGNATQMDGVDDYFNIGTGSTITDVSSNNLTLIAWIKPDVLKYTSIIDSTDSTTSPYAMRITSNGQVEVSLKLSGTQYTKTFGEVGAIVVGSWSMIAFTFDGTNWKCYINKVAQTPQTQAGTLDSTANGIVLGRYT